MPQPEPAPAGNNVRPGRPKAVIAGRYEVKDTLGEGGMGVIFRAYDPATKRDVAIKTMRDSVDPVAVELFTKEWTLLATLSHPNIVDILDSGEFEMSGKRRPFFVMPLLPGKTLDELIRASSQRLTVERVVEIVVQTCRGLAAAHERGLIHRDLKPSNIFVMDDDTAKIIDFGVVHLAGSHSISGVKGTLQYMAPEQLELKPATAQSDIFSLGVVTYEALTGRKPFARNTEAAIVEAVRSHIPPPASELNPSVNELVSRVVHKAMAKQPWHRFDSAREFADALRKALRNEPIERFERTKIQPRIERVGKAFSEGDLQFAHEILSELEAEGNIDPEMAVLRIQIDQANRHRTVRQLLENARIRFEQEEYPLALQKIQEVLAIDPDNADALRMREEIDSRRSQRQLEKWLTLMRQHLHSGAFADARKCVDEALKLGPKDTRVRKAQLELQRLEEQMAAARKQKDQLYGTAMEAFRNGEVSTALSQLERVLSLIQNVPDRAFPDRDARYQQFYNQVRGEHDAMRMSFEEARRALSAKEFRKALAVCDEYLNRYPSQALFQALRLEITESERQELSAFIAETAHRVEAEPDLDRKLAILKAAAERYPDETHFQQSLKLVRERRDLVSSIVIKARQYEERGQFTEAIGQWQILKNIYPPYPGLSFELEQLERRREMQSRDEAKARWIGELEPLVAGGEFEKAVELSGQALLEHPDDPEIEALRKAAQEGIEKRGEAGRLLDEGMALCAQGDYTNGIVALRCALEFDGRNAAVHRELVQALVASARTLTPDRWQEAEPLVREALDLEPDHAGARALRTVIQDGRRRQAVTDALAEARQHQLRGEFDAAIRKVDECLQAYPNEARLLQLRALLAKAAGQAPKPVEPPPVVAPPLPAPAKGDATETLPFQPQPPAAKAPRLKLPAFKLPTLPVPSRRTIALAGAAVVLLAAAGWWVVSRRSPQPPPAAAHSIELTIANVPSAEVRIGGQVAKPPYRLAEGEHQVQISAEGYETWSQTVRVVPGGQDRPVSLIPALQRLRIETTLQRGKVWIDDAEAGELAEGAFTKDDLSLEEHKIRVVDGTRTLIEVRFRSAEAALAEVQAPVTGQDVLVLSSLGDRVKLWAGPGAPRVGPRDQPPQAIPPEGLLFPSGGELAAEGRKNPLRFDAGNAPTLAIVAGDATQGFLLTITSNVEDANILIENRPVNWKFNKGRAIRRLPPGKYTVKLSREGYFDQELAGDLGKGDARLDFELKPVPTVAALAIEGGTPLAEVWIGSERAGALDAQGSALFDQVRPGDHEITLRRDQFEPKRIGRRNFVAGETVRVGASEAQLVPFGVLQFQVTPAEAAVSFRREDETEYRDAKNGQSIAVRQGAYRVKATAAGFEAMEAPFAVEPGKPTRAAIALKRVENDPKPAPRPVPKPTLFDKTWKQGEDGMWSYDGPGYGWLGENRGVFDIELEKRGRFGGSTEWVVGSSPNRKEKVIYRLGRDGTLKRRVTTADKELPEVTASKRIAGDKTFRLRIEIAPWRIVIRDRANGGVVDEVNLGADVTLGRFGFQRGVRLKAALVQ